MKKSYLLAIIIAVAAVLWISSKAIIPGGGDEEGKGAQPQEQAQKAPMKVRVQVVLSENYTKRIISNGRSEASRDVTLRAEAEGQVTEVIASEGQKIAKGDKIIAIDVRERRERVSEAEELVKQRRIEFEAAKKLIKQGYASDVRLAQTQSAYESAQAALKRAQIDLEKTTITAPFDGVLGRRYVDVGDYLRTGDEVTDIVDLTPLKVTVFVNENEVMKIHEGNTAMLRFSNGENRQGVVRFVAPSADQATRTFQVDVELDNETNSLPAGLTAQVEIKVDSQKAFQIAPSVLTLDDEGEVGVKIVNNDNKVEFIPVTIIDDTASLMWVTGLRDNQKVVTVGQDFIVPGQTVEPVKEEAE